MLQASGVTTRGAECVVVGRSNIVGKPMAALMIGADSTVTVCHSRTRDLADHTRRADILIVAAGRAQMVTSEMVKPGAVVIDVGMNRIPDATKKSGTRLVGDVDFDSVRPVASMITPVPGGVGKMTIAMLMKNTVRAAEQQARWRPRPPADDLSLFEEAGDVFPGASPASALSISALTSVAKDILEGAFIPMWVRGEVADFKAHRSGHWYFSLRDETSQVRCAVWSREARRLPASPDNGMQVVACGRLTVYAARGEMQFTVTQLAAEGDGLWRKALELTRSRLEADGLLAPERKRTLPAFPRTIAVVTSPDGAALRDIIAVIRRRGASLRLVVATAAVQGENAPGELCAALEQRVGSMGKGRSRDRRSGAADHVMICGRSTTSGSREPWQGSPVPTISAVGHEIDMEYLRPRGRRSRSHALCGCRRSRLSSARRTDDDATDRAGEGHIGRGIRRRLDAGTSRVEAASRGMGERHAPRWACAAHSRRGDRGSPRRPQPGSNPGAWVCRGAGPRWPWLGQSGRFLRREDAIRARRACAMGSLRRRLTMYPGRGHRRERTDIRNASRPPRGHRDGTATRG